MRRAVSRLSAGIRASRELGFRQVSWYALYRLGLRAGHYRRVTPLAQYEPWQGELRVPFRLPERQSLTSLLTPEQRGSAEREAEEIMFGQIRLFGGPPVLLNILHPPGVNPNRHWTVFEDDPGAAGVEDFKFLWEPARFGFAYTLARAYALTGDERYPAVFWAYFDNFLQANPPNAGANWVSAQEVALRLVAFLFAAGAFSGSPRSNPERRAQLAGAVAAHAARIPATLSYARAQNNNHLISEALGLTAAGSALPDHPDATHWKELGERCLDEALLHQIHPDGVYAQHSTNYHRLMLHAALLAQTFGARITPAAMERLGAATHWLIAQVDPASGRAPNFGANDGANILPLAHGSFADYRPTVQAAARAFLGRDALPPGAWDELSLWLNQDTLPQDDPLPSFPPSPAVHRLGDRQSWAVLRAARFRERPSHADQLHVDLWWHGDNIAIDAGTFRYTDDPPWDHGLARTIVHNTVLVNGQDQMRRAGRFLWLDWAQGSQLPVEDPTNTVAAQHDGYQKLSILHRRVLERLPTGWLVTDSILPLAPKYAATAPLRLELHWLMPDWRWSLEVGTLTLRPPRGGMVELALSTNAHNPTFTLARAGQVLSGVGPVSPLRGWFSPTYSIKNPALSFSLAVEAAVPCVLSSRWTLLEPGE